MKPEKVKLHIQLFGGLLMLCSLGFILVNLSHPRIDTIVICAIPFTIAGALLVFYSIFLIPSR